MEKFNTWFNRNFLKRNSDSTQTYLPSDSFKSKSSVYPPTQTYDKDDTTHPNHPNQPINQLVDFFHKNIDMLPSEPDTVEHTISLLAQCLPHTKKTCQFLNQLWRQFKLNLNRHISENQWWGNEAPNPVLYDSVLTRLNDLDNIFQKMHTLCLNCGDEQVKQAFIKFQESYGKTIPTMRTMINNFKQHSRSG